MKFDNIIIGGGLSGLTCGIALAKAGKQVAIVAAGQSTLHFSSGSLGLLGFDNEGHAVTNPLEAVASLPAGHPYKKIGADAIPSLADQAITLLKEAGIALQGDISKNHFRLTPIGQLKPTWLTLEGMAVSDSCDILPYTNILLVNIEGYMDFPVHFIKENIKSKGAIVKEATLNIAALSERRSSPSEMRSSNLAKILQNEGLLNELATCLNELAREADVIWMPAILGLTDASVFATLKEKVNKPLYMVATMPPSVPGIRIQNLLKARFVSLGGTFLLGHKVTEGQFKGNQLISVNSSALPEEPLEASEFILATGSFQSNGLASNYEKVYEPLFDLDVDASAQRTDWVKEDVYEAQPYMEYGVSTTEKFQVLKQGSPITNLYAVGSILSGHNFVKLADGEGVDIFSALTVAQNILK